MATAKRTTDTKIVKKMVETEVSETTRTITLTLTPDEALTLGLILSAVGGSPFESRRQHADSVHKALRAVGINGLERPKGVKEIEGTVMFRQDDRRPDFDQGAEFKTGAKIKRVTDEHWFANGDYGRDYADAECRKGDMGTVTSAYDDRVLVRWDKGNTSCIALECLQVVI